MEDAPWQALDPAQRRQRTLDALKRLLLRESQVQPLLLVSRTCTGSTRDPGVPRCLVESLPAARLLLLVNYRPEYQHGWGTKTSYAQLRLDALPPASADDLLQSLLGDDAGLEPLKQRLIERTQGNPFFLEESVRTLVETQVLVGSQGAYHLAGALPRSRCQPRSRRCWRRASTGCRRRKNGSCRPPQSLARRCPWRFSGYCRDARRFIAPWDSPISGRRVPLRDTPLPRARVYLQARPHAAGGLRNALQERRRPLHARSWWPSRP